MFGDDAELWKPILKTIFDAEQLTPEEIHGVSFSLWFSASATNSFWSVSTWPTPRDATMVADQAPPTIWECRPVWYCFLAFGWHWELPYREGELFFSPLAASGIRSGEKLTHCSSNIVWNFENLDHFVIFCPCWNWKAKSWCIPICCLLAGVEHAREQVPNATSRLPIHHRFLLSSNWGHGLANTMERHRLDSKHQWLFYSHNDWYVYSWNWFPFGHLPSFYCSTAKTQKRTCQN